MDLAERGADLPLGDGAGWLGIFPDRTALIRLVGAVLAEQHDEWTEGRRYLGLDILARARLSTVTDSPPSTLEEVPTSDIPALSA